MEIFILIILLIVAAIPAFIASSKGRGFFLWFLYGLFLFPFAFIHAIVIKPNENAKGMAKCPNCASIISDAAKICPSCRTRLDEEIDERFHNSDADKSRKADFNGERNLLSSAYQLYLTKRFDIEKNSTLEKYVIDNQVFDTLEEALQEADLRYESFLKEALQQKELVRLQVLQRKEQLNREFIHEQERLKREQEEYLAREPERIANKKKLLRKIYYYIFVGVSVIVASVILYKPIENYYAQYKAELKAENDREQLIITQTNNERERVALHQRMEVFKNSNNKFIDSFYGNKFFNAEIGSKNLGELGKLLASIKLEKNYRDYDVTISNEDLKKFNLEDNTISIISTLSFRYCIPDNKSFDLTDESKYKLLTLEGINVKFKDKANEEVFQQFLLGKFTFDLPSSLPSIVTHVVDDKFGVGLQRKQVDVSGKIFTDACGNKLWGT